MIKNTTKSNIVANAIKCKHSYLKKINPIIAETNLFSTLKQFKNITSTISISNDSISNGDEEPTIHKLPLFVNQTAISQRNNAVSTTSSKKTSSNNILTLEKLTLNIAKKIKVCIKCHCPGILIADDNDFNRFTMQKQLIRLGINIDQAANGKAAVDKIFEKGACSCRGYKLVFMDYDMPILNGVEATIQIMEGVSKGSTFKGIVIVGLSAYSCVKDINTCLDAGMKDFSKTIISC